MSVCVSVVDGCDASHPCEREAPRIASARCAARCCVAHALDRCDAARPNDPVVDERARITVPVVARLKCVNASVRELWVSWVFLIRRKSWHGQGVQCKTALAKFFRR